MINILILLLLDVNNIVDVPWFLYALSGIWHINYKIKLIKKTKEENGTTFTFWITTASLLIHALLIYFIVK